MRRQRFYLHDNLDSASETSRLYQSIEWMNEWMSEWINEWVDEWMDK